MKVLRQALTTIVTADATIRTLCGRTTDLLIRWKSLAAAQLPVVTLQIVDEKQTPESGEKWLCLVRLTAWADEQTGGLATVEDLIARLRTIVTYTSFAALTPPLEATAWGVREQRDVEAMVGEAPPQQGRFRLDLEMTIRLTVS